MYHLDDGYGAVLGLYLTTFAGTLPFPMDGEYQNCSMVEDPATGTLYLSYFTGNSTEFYGLYPQRDADGKIQSFRAGKLGAWRRMSGPWPLYQATAIDAQTSGKRLCQQYRGCYHPNGGVHRHGPGCDAQCSGGGHPPLERCMQCPTSGTATQSDGKLRVPVEVSTGSHSGLVTVNYDATALTLEDVATYGELTSLRQEEGFVTLGFADLEASPPPLPSPLRQRRTLRIARTLPTPTSSRRKRLARLRSRWTSGRKLWSCTVPRKPSPT